MAKEETKRLPWAERIANAQEKFPSSVHLDWNDAFRGDEELWGRVVTDILKTTQTVPGRSGPRPALEREPAISTLKQMMGVDFTYQPFSDAVRMLSRNASQKQIAEKTGLDRNLIQRLLSESKQPDLYVMETIAEAYGKHASFFMEWRVFYVLGAIGDQMEKAPEISVDLYKKLRRR